MGTNMLSINQIENTFFNLTAQSGEKKTSPKTKQIRSRHISIAGPHILG
jgi:hypothetical protein